MQIDAPTVGLMIVGIPTTYIAYLGYRRARKVDAIAERAGIATSEAGSIQQVIEGLQGLLSVVQTDNRDVREQLQALEGTLKLTKEDCAREVAELTSRFRELEAEMASLRR